MGTGRADLVSREFHAIFLREGERKRVSENRKREKGGGGEKERRAKIVRENQRKKIWDLGFFVIKRGQCLQYDGVGLK